MQRQVYERNYSLGEASFSLGERTLIMGILNVTPDSFSDGGRYTEVDRAVTHALQMVADGADLIDIGGESTRPGHIPVGEQEELERIIPVIEGIHREAPQIPISIDTYKAVVAKEALKAGAHIINDIWGLKKDPHMAEVAAQFDCPVILMHNRNNRDYVQLIDDMIQDLLASVKIAEAAGVKSNNIILDPGIGFAKDFSDNLKVMHSLDRLTELGYPMLLATSRKRFIRTVLELESNEVSFGTAATVAFGIAQGCQLVRVHDVRDMKRTVKMCDAIYYI